MQGSKAKDWLEDQQSRLLPCSYFMITFTVPNEFRPFIRSHPKECYWAIFDAARLSLIKLAKDPRFIGSGEIGMTGVLHTKVFSTLCVSRCDWQPPDQGSEVS